MVRVAVPVAATVILSASLLLSQPSNTEFVVTSSSAGVKNIFSAPVWKVIAVNSESLIAGSLLTAFMRAEYRVELHNSSKTYVSVSPNSICCSSFSNSSSSLLSSNTYVASAIGTQESVTSFAFTLAENIGGRNRRSVELSGSSRLCFAQENKLTRQSIPTTTSIDRYLFFINFIRYILEI